MDEFTIVYNPGGVRYDNLPPQALTFNAYPCLMQKGRKGFIAAKLTAAQTYERSRSMTPASAGTYFVELDASV